MLTKGAAKAQQSKSTKWKNIPDPEPQKSTKNSTTNEESDPDLENELDEENALNELAGEQDLSTDGDEVCVPFLQQLSNSRTTRLKVSNQTLIWTLHSPSLLSPPSSQIAKKS
jgi:hypothetical protein